MTNKRVQKTLRIALAAGLLSLCMGSNAYAACTTPTAPAGSLQMVSGTMKYCANTAWRDLANIDSTVACSTLGEIKYIPAPTTPNHLCWCNGTKFLRSAQSTSYGTCTAAQGGYFYYSATDTYYWFCNGSNWRRMGP